MDRRDCSLLLMALVLITTGCASSETTKASTSPSPSPSKSSQPTFAVYGDVELAIDERYHGASGATFGGECVPDDAYDDVTGGTQVIVATDTGETLALADLEEPRFQPGEGSEEINDGHCLLAFRVDDVPEGRNFYSIQIGRRGGQQYTRDQLKDRLHLVLR